MFVFLTLKSSPKIPYPRGKYRSQLGEDGLIGKIRLMSTMNGEDVKDEIRSVFQEPMGSRVDFPFVFLQPTGIGARTLTVPSVSNSFCWTAQQVAKLGGHKTPIYILARDALTLPEVYMYIVHAKFIASGISLLHVYTGTLEVQNYC